MFQAAAFYLRSWASNSQILHAKMELVGINDADDVSKLLGMRWDPRSDIITFPQRKSPKNHNLATKREVRKEVSSVYDPHPRHPRLTQPSVGQGKDDDAVAIAKTF